MAYLKWLVPLTLLYVMLTGNIELQNWILGLLIAISIVALLRPKPEPVPWKRLPRAIWSALVFVLALSWDLFASGFQVARLILQAKPDLQQGIVAIPVESNEEWVTTLSAEAITLTPGEMVVEIGEDGTFFIHTLNVSDTLANAPEAQAKRARQLEEIAP